MRKLKVVTPPICKETRRAKQDVEEPGKNRNNAIKMIEAYAKDRVDLSQNFKEEDLLKAIASLEHKDVTNLWKKLEGIASYCSYKSVSEAAQKKLEEYYIH